MIPALGIVNLSCYVRDYWTFKKKKLLHDVNLVVNEGESFGFLGHNGAGKTTTIKCILGPLCSTSGEIRIFGRDGKETESRALVGYLAEQPYFYDYLSVWETMELYATLAGVGKSVLKEAIQSALDLVKVSARAKSPMRALSKGLTQRVALAQAIVANPKLLVLDEPFSGLDPIGRKEFRDIFQQLKQTGTTIFMSSHVLSDVEFLCDRVSIMARGHLKGVFTVSEIPRFTGGCYELTVLASPEAHSCLKPYVDEIAASERFLRCRIGKRETAESALSAAITSKLHVESYTFEQGTLEELFVKLVTFEEGSK